MRRVCELTLQRYHAALSRSKDGRATSERLDTLPMPPVLRSWQSLIGEILRVITELRRYSVRRGALNQMHTRMSNVLLPLFKEHGIPAPLAIWETSGDDASLLTWLLRWPTLEQRNASWAAFRPTWEAAKRVRAEQEFVTRTDLTLIDPWPEHALAFASAESACESAWIVQAAVGRGAEFRLACIERLFPDLRAYGALAIVPCEFVFGPLPQALILVSWPTPEVRRAGLDQMQSGMNLEAKHIVAGSWSVLDRASYLKTWSLTAPQ